MSRSKRARQTTAMLFSAIIGSVVLGCVVFASPAASAEPDRTPAEWLAWFHDQWNEGNWTGRGGPNPTSGYLRTADDRDWQARMLTLQGLAAAGADAVPVLTAAVENADAPDAERILAAQAIGYLAPHASMETLLDWAENDPHPAVRLYAVDALGMQGAVDAADRLAELRENESNRDVKKHIGYAIARAAQGVDPRVVEELIKWDAANIDTAKIGQAAPDFTAPSLSEEQVRLSQFRGQQAVVLVFIYGDT